MFPDYLSALLCTTMIHCIALKPLSFYSRDLQRRISWCHFVEIMFFYNKEKAVIKNDFLERGWNAYKLCMEHPTKSWNRVSACSLLKRFQEDNSMDKRVGSGRQRTNTTEGNENLI